MINVVYKEKKWKPSPNIILTSEKPETLPWRLGIKQESPLSSLLFNIILESLGSTIRQNQKGNKRIRDWKKRCRAVFVHRWYDYLCRKSKEMNKKILKLIIKAGEYKP